MRPALQAATRLAAPILLAAAATIACAAQSQPAASPRFDGARALEDVRQLVAIGPRAAGTDGAVRAREYITRRLKEAGLDVVEQRFEPQTPAGPLDMVNLRARIPGTSPGAGSPPNDRRVIVAGHYDTKRFREFTFLGANDGGSSAAFLIELARVLKPRTLPIDVELLFLDGEEAVVEWQGDDHTYGSRHYVEAERRAGTLDRIGAFVLVDMIGDRDLRILREANSTPWLTDQIWSTAARLGKRQFVADTTPIEDDHLEFLAAGVPSVDIIDLDYPAWHTAADTLDKVSASSLQAVGDVLLAALPDICKRAAVR
jgi:Zn-dependent M28 family amino/carboxypeptidase